MEKYNNIRNNAPNALNATTTTTAIYKTNNNKAVYQSIDIAHQFKAEFKKTHSQT